MAEPPPLHIRRFRIGANVLLQILICALIALLINYLGFTRYARWDLSRDQNYSLSDQTRKVLSSLKKDVRIYVFFSPRQSSSGALLFNDVRYLTDEYESVGRKKVKVQIVDPYRDLSRARELQAKYKFGDAENLLILDYDGRTKTLRLDELARFESVGASEDQLVVQNFTGEQAITSAIIELVEGRKMRIGYITGHGEPDLGEEGPLTRWKQYVERQNIELETIDLNQAQKITAETAAVVLAGPRYDLDPKEIALLRSYWAEQGRLLILLNPKYPTPNLDRFLQEVGIEAAKSILVTSMQTGIDETSVTLDIYAKFLPESSFLKPLRDAIGYFPGGTRSLTFHEQKDTRATRMLRPAIDSYWGETEDITRPGADPRFDPETDAAPPLEFGVAIEKGSIEDERVQVRNASRMIVIGNADFIRDECLSRAGPDVDFLLLSLNWITNRETLLGITPKTPHTFTLNLSEKQLLRILLLTTVAIPLLAGAAGSAVWFVRRR
jgi:gliding motility-associatede transport system auxiliary component